MVPPYFSINKLIELINSTLSDFSDYPMITEETELPLMQKSSCSTTGANRAQSPKLLAGDPIH